MHDTSNILTISTFANHAINACRDYGNKVVGEVTLDQAYGGARGVKCLVWEVGHDAMEPTAADEDC